MLRSLHVENFRALREFRMTGLGRVNLLVGTNNCGKTSVLEALNVLLAPGWPPAIWGSLVRRGESSGVEVEIGHLVHGHRADANARFSIGGIDGPATLHANAVVRPISNADIALVQLDARVRRGGNQDELAEQSRLVFETFWRRDDHQTDSVQWLVSPRGGIDPSGALATPSDPVADEPVAFVTTEGVSLNEVVSLFGQSALTPGEDLVLAALQTIEPRLERLAIVTSRELRTARSRGGLAAMVDGQRIPIGSMGDGIWRLLGIALSLVRAQGRVLLVDEIDTGLHYTVLEKMWRLVFETAERLNVQVFATTHSRDCYEALAAITQPDRHEVSIQRIERGRVDAVSFDEGAISAAAARDIEVR